MLCYNHTMTTTYELSEGITYIMPYEIPENAEYRVFSNMQVRLNKVSKNIEQLFSLFNQEEKGSFQDLLPNQKNPIYSPVRYSQNLNKSDMEHVKSHK